MHVKHEANYALMCTKHKRQQHMNAIYFALEQAQ
jgi:hypothetical protein